MFTKKSKIVIVGAGKIAYSLTAALLGTGYNVAYVVSSKKSSALKLAKKFEIPGHANKLSSLSQNIKIYFLTIPDNQIRKTGIALSKLNLDFKNSLFIHVSGALSIKELSALKRKGGYTASFHIMQTFPSKKIVKLKNCAVAIESENIKAINYLKKLAQDLGLKSFYIKPDKKIYYHLAGVFASNFLVGNLFASEKIFQITNADKSVFFDIINSTVNSTLSNINENNPANALSGPIERGDYETIKKHIKALKKKDKHLRLSYVIQSLFLINVAGVKKGKLNTGQLKIKEILIRDLNQLKEL